jgi:hypothetical protein
VSPTYGDVGMLHNIHPTRIHEIKGTKHLIITRNEYYMDMIDLEDELKDAKILTPGLSV